jgi:CPA1 family monovalent cation:H+ antiporter
VRGFEALLALLLASALLAAVARRLRVPAPIVMVFGGVAAAFLPLVQDVQLNPDVAFAIFVPPLLFRAAVTTSVREIRDHLRSVTLLAVGLIVATMVAVGATAHAAIPGLAWAPAFVLGAIVSPPDAVISIALVRALKAPRTLVALVEGEGLLNDTTAFVVYAQAVQAVTSGRFSLARSVPQFFLVGLGGVAVGFAVYLVVARTSRIWKDPVLLNVVWLLVPFAAFLPAEAIGASGVLAVVVAGVLLKRKSSLGIAAEARMQATGVYDVVEFVLNSLLFILIGMEVGAILRDPGAPPLRDLLRTTAIVTAAVVLVRIAWMYPSAYLPRLWPSIRQREGMPTLGGVAVLSWMGIRGGDSLVTALALPRTTTAGLPFPNRELIVTSTFGVIVATMLLQGLTLGPLIKLLRLPADRSIDAELRLARREMAATADAWLDGAAAQQVAPTGIVERVRRHYERKTQLELDLDGADEDRAKAEAYREVEQGVIAARRRAAVSLRDRGVIDDEVLGRLERELDLEELRVTPDADD